jgi:TonB family protein
MSITGNLRTLELSELLQWLAQGTKTGVLIIENEDTEKRIYFDHGTIVSSESSDSQEHLGHFLIEEGLIDEPTLARALKLQQATQILLGKVLVTLGAITENELNQVLQQKTQETIYELFSWPEGEFRFVPDDLPEFPMVPMALDVTNLVLEGMRRLDEENHSAAGNVEDQASADAREIEETLASDILDPLSISSVEIPKVVDDVSASRERSSVIEEDLQGTIAPSVRGFYETAAAKKDNRVKLLAAVAAGVVVILIGVMAYFFWPAEPSEARTQVPPESAPRFTEFEPAPTLEEVGLLPAPEGESDMVATADIEPPVPSGETRQEDRLRADYERELATLRNQLREAQREAEENKAPAATELAGIQLAANSGDLPQNIGRTTVVAPQEDPEIPMEEVSPADDSSASDMLGAAAVDTGGATDSQEPPTTDPLESDLVASAVEALPEQPEVERGDLVQPGPGVQAPTVVKRPQPRYPDAARRLGRTAVVILRLLIDEQGNVAEIQQNGPKAGMGFDRAAVAAAEKTTWQPAMVGDVPVKMWIDLRIEFKP